MYINKKPLCGEVIVVRGAGSHNLETGLNLRHSPAFVRWYVLLIIGTLRAKGIRKNVPSLEVGGSAPAPPTPIIMSHIKD